MTLKPYLGLRRAASFLDLVRVPLQEEAIAYCQQRWAQEHADKAEGE